MKLILSLVFPFKGNPFCPENEITNKRMISSGAIKEFDYKRCGILKHFN